MLTCPRCTETKPFEAFNRDATRKSGRNIYCRICQKGYQSRERAANAGKHVARQRLARKANPTWSRAAAQRHREDFPKAAAARDAVRNEVKRGRLVRQPCSALGCDKTYTHAHHDDYDQPLAVRWLCPKHHREWHEANGPGANLTDSP